MKPVRLLIVGAGGRGTTYAEYAAAHPDLAQVVGVAEPRAFYRERLSERHQIAPQNVTTDWRELAERPRFADAVVIATPDRLHTEPAVAFAERQYAILLEKPMATNLAECRRIAEAAEAHGVILAVCHVLRYTAYTQQLKDCLAAGLIGEVVSIQHLEPVGYWHQAHSFVRGNWRNEAESTFMLLAKSCHDLDWLQYLMGRRCERVASFGSRQHFRREAKPRAAGAATRCLACAYESQCPYSAQKIYFGLLRAGNLGWPLNVVTADLTEAGVTQALQTGPYGRCVYECDNDVVDHQVVNMLYDTGATVSFTMTAFTEFGDRQTRIFGTRGELRGDGQKIIHYDFLTERTQTLAAAPEGAAGQMDGHGGGDYGLMQSFVAAVTQGEAGLVRSGAAESLDSHRVVFAAELARREGRVVEVDTVR